MECVICKENMLCYDDVNGYTLRIDWFKCPKCQSKAEIVYNPSKKYIEKVTWTR